MTINVHYSNCETIPIQLHSKMMLCIQAFHELVKL